MEQEKETLHIIYQKQVEAWKERFAGIFEMADKYIEEHGYDSGTPLKTLVLSSRHKDTIELLEAEIERKKGMRRSVKDEYGSGNFRWIEDEIQGYNQAIDDDIAYLEEQLALIKKEI